MVSVSHHPKLLPSGLQDTLAPDAALDRRITNQLLDRFALFGYQQVAPPLLEFEETLLSGKGAAHTEHSFRVMDPLSQKMMAMRADITPQIHRIVHSLRSERGKEAIRLSYAGQVLRVSPSDMSKKRQLRQAGIELIGMTPQQAVMEVSSAALEALEQVGLNEIVVSLSYGGLFERMFGQCLHDSQAMIRKAIFHKDSGSLPEPMPYKALTEALLSGDMDRALSEDMSGVVGEPISALHSVQKQLAERFGEQMTILCDPLDHNGFDYYDGVCFVLLEPHSRQEIGRGGCYLLDDTLHGCGVTLYIDRMIHAPLSETSESEVRELAHGVPYREAKALRDEGIVTITHSDNHLI